MWTYHAGNVDFDNFLTDTITVAQDNLFYNEDGIYQYTYHIEDNELFIHRPNRAVKQYLVDTNDYDINTKGITHIHIISLLVE